MYTLHHLARGVRNPPAYLHQPVHLYEYSDKKTKQTMTRELWGRVETDLQRFGVCVAAGTSSFIVSCAASQFLQLALLRLHPGSRILLFPAPSLVGAVTVGAASFASFEACRHSIAVADGRTAHGQLVSMPTAAVIGSMCFYMLGGRFWRLSPSSLTQVGAIANTRHGSLPATLAYATAKEREAIQQLGRRFGCHSCGVRSWRFNRIIYHADHQPPLAEVKRANAAAWRRIFAAPVSQRFYPQCARCSGKQAAVLAERTQLITRLGSPRKALRAASVPPGVFHMPSLLRPHYAVGAVLSGLTFAAPGALDTADVAIQQLIGMVQQQARKPLSHAQARGGGEAASRQTVPEVHSKTSKGAFGDFSAAAVAAAARNMK